jgi:hypothetical protein
MTMRDVWRAFAALGLAALLAGPALAQRGDVGVPGVLGRSPWRLLANESVQKELKLTDGQKQKVKTLSADLRKKVQEIRQKLQGVSPGDLTNERQKLLNGMGADTKKRVAEILDGKQQKRFQQIRVFVMVQQGGVVAAAGNPAVARALELNADQAKQLKVLRDDYTKRRSALVSGPRPPEPEKMAELRKEFNEKCDKVLLDDQKKTLKELQGAPFDYKPTGRGGNLGRDR